MPDESMNGSREQYLLGQAHNAITDLVADYLYYGRKNDEDLSLKDITDLVADYLYYGRKHDEDLSLKDMASLIHSGVLTTEMIVKWFEEEIKDAINRGEPDVR